MAPRPVVWISVEGEFSSLLQKVFKVRAALWNLISGLGLGAYATVLSSSLAWAPSLHNFHVDV